MFLLLWIRYYHGIETCSTKYFIFQFASRTRRGMLQLHPLSSRAHSSPPPSPVMLSASDPPGHFRFCQIQHLTADHWDLAPEPYYAFLPLRGQGRRGSRSPHIYALDQTPTPYPADMTTMLKSPSPMKIPSLPLASRQSRRECTCPDPSSVWHRDKPDGNTVTSSRQD